MKKEKYCRTVLIIFAACLFVCFAQERLQAQEDRPVLGRPGASGSQPDPSKPKTRKSKRNVTKSPVPKGKSLEFYVSKGSELIDAGDYELALLHFDEGQKRRKDKAATPELLDLLDKLSQAAKLHIDADGLEDEEFEKTLAVYEEILKIRANDPKAKEQVPALKIKMAEAALEAKDYARAVQIYEKLTAEDPNDKGHRAKLVEAVLGRSEMELKDGKEDAAKASFKRVLELDPGNKRASAALQNFELRANMKTAEEKLASGDFEEAIRKFNEVLVLDPVNERAKAGIEQAQKGALKAKADRLYLDRKFLDAEREYRAALTALPDDQQIKQRLLELSLRLGPPLPLKGRAAWRGKAQGPVKVQIKGKTLSYADGEANGTLVEGLPGVPYLIKRFKRTGANSRILEQPSPANGYATVVLIEPKKKGADATFEIEWELKRQGRLVWNGKVSGRSLIRLQGPFVDVEPVIAAKDAQFQFDGIPHQEALVKVRKISGNPEVRLVELPSQANLYTATVAVESQSENEALSFELEWQLK